MLESLLFSDGETMGAFQYRAGELHCEGVSLRVIAESVGTPAYVYSKTAILDNFLAYDRAFAEVPHTVFYAIKANANLAVLAALARAGAGADITSGGELYRALRAGIPAKRILFAGPGKTREEMREALKAEILMFNVESAAELRVLDQVAQQMGVRAPVALRINPDVDPHTHKYIATGLRTAKFGIPVAEALREYESAVRMGSIELLGVQMHIGSQLVELSPFVDSLARIAALVKQLRERDIDIKMVDLGGGLGIRYRDEEPPSPEQYARALLPPLRELGATVLLEPGRSIVGNAGVLLTRALYPKQTPDKRFLIVDAAMNDLIRPSLYGAHHEIVPVRELTGRRSKTDVVGPICESGDFLGKDRKLPEIGEGELLAVMSAGAYGFTMASQYNARPRAPEVLVEGDHYRTVRRRESYEDLVAGETLE
jgi:diaminopimelate decarboxylase